MTLPRSGAKWGARRITHDDYRLSEDFSFCERWRACGEIWANVNHEISHVGPVDFHMSYGDVLEAKAAAAKAAAAVAVADQIVADARPRLTVGHTENPSDNDS
jgi:hypothetical protein